MLGDAIYHDLMNQYDIFLEVRPAIMGELAEANPPTPREAAAGTTSSRAVAGPE